MVTHTQGSQSLREEIETYSHTVHKGSQQSTSNTNDNRTNGEEQTTTPSINQEKMPETSMKSTEATQKGEKTST